MRIIVDIGEQEEIAKKIWELYPINEELYPTPDLKNAYSAGIIDVLLTLKDKLEKL
jgi:hypothetical protein